MINALKIIKITTLLFLLTPYISFAQIQIPEGYSEMTESPSNGRKIEKIVLHFDMDSINDSAILVENTSEFYKYKLLLFLSSQEKTFEIDLINLNDMSLYPVQITSRKNVIEFGYYEDGTAAFGRFMKLRFNTKKNQIQVIGYDVEYKASLSERINKSYNLVTGKYIVKRTSYDENGKATMQEFPGVNDFFKNKVFIEDLDADMLVNLDDVGSPYE